MVGTTGNKQNSSTNFGDKHTTFGGTSIYGLTAMSWLHVRHIPESELNW